MKYFSIELLSRNATASPDGDAVAVLYSIDVGSIWSFGTFRNIKCYFVTFPKIFEFYVFQLVGMEKEIFFLAFASNESKSSISKPSNCALLHIAKNKLNKFSNTEC